MVGQGDPLGANRIVAESGVVVEQGQSRVVSQFEIFALGGERTSGYWSDRQCDAQIVSNLTVQRRLKLF
jgi:phage gp46-like protein